MRWIVWSSQYYATIDGHRMEAVSERACLMQQVSQCLRRDNRVGVCKCEQIAIAADQQIGTARNRQM